MSTIPCLLSLKVKRGLQFECNILRKPAGPEDHNWEHFIGLPDNFKVQMLSQALDPFQIHTQLLVLGRK